LQFDRPIRNLNEARDHRLVAVDLVADEKFPSHDPRRRLVHLSNNRGTPSPDDDHNL